jgi:hypothetical protein
MRLKNTKQTNRKEDKTYRKRLQRKIYRPSGLTRRSQLMRQDHSGYSKYWNSRKELSNSLVLFTGIFKE